MDSEFEQITADILSDPLFLETKNVVHHGGCNTLYDHSVATAQMAYDMALYFELSEESVRSVTRAALLHDFFGYDWRGEWFKSYLHQYTGLQRLRHMHAFVHGAIAAERASEHFELTARQYNAIASHMFPLAFSLPRSGEAWIVTAADKLVASRECTVAVGWYLMRFCRRHLATAQTKS